MDETLYAKPLFEDFSEQEMAELLKFSKALKFQPGEYLFKQDDISQSIYIIFSGTVELSAINNNDEEISFPVIGNGTVLGEIAFFDGKPRTASAKAIENLESIIISQEDFSRLENNNPSLAIKILKEFGRITAERLRWADEVLVELID
jgi:CRP/FNR family cyclic AMP-dependent transcriptional regulator